MPKWIFYGTCCVLLAFVFARDELENPLNNQFNDFDAKEHGSGKEADAGVKLPSEVQRAVCTVNAGEVKATAEAVTTKTLKGVCGSDEMKLAFRNLEDKLYGELREIKELLGKVTQAREPLTSTLIPIAPLTSSLDKAIKSKANTPKMNKFEQITLKPIQQNKLRKLPQLKQIETAQEREDEIGRFNNTMLTDQDFNLFTYYWKLENFTGHMESGLITTVSSPIFSIRGKTLQLKCTYQHLHRDMIYLQLALAHSSNDHGEKQNNIVLDMGGQWKELKWTDYVPLKHKISLLDQRQHHGRSQDLSSQELTKLDMGFFIPNSAILGSNYIRNNSLLIQVILYL